MNEDLDQIIAQLQSLDDALYDRRLTAQTVAERSKLAAESHALSTRIERLQGRLFAIGTRDLSVQLDRITRATAEVKEAIREIDDLNAALGGVANLLGIVDSLIAIL